MTLTGASQALVVANSNRVALYVTAPAASVTVVLGPQVAVAGQGIVVAPTTTVKIDGYTGAVFVIGTNGQVVGFVEI